MKLPKLFLADKDSDKHAKNLLKRQKDMSKEVYALFSKYTYGIYGLNLYTNNSVLFEFHMKIKDFAIHHNKLYISTGGSLFAFREGLKDLFFYTVTSLLPFKGELYNSCEDKVFKTLSKEPLVNRRFKIVSLLEYEDRLCDVVKFPDGELHVYDTLTNELITESVKPAEHVAVLNGEFYFSDGKGSIFHKNEVFNTPSTSITALSVVNEELFFSGVNLENRIMALNPETKEQRIVVDLEDKSKSLITQIKEDKVRFVESLE